MYESRESITLEINRQKIFGILHLPLDYKPGKTPAVLLCHGFGGNKSGKFRLFVRQAELLAHAGIASFRFDFRGAGDSEGDFQDTTLSSLTEDAKIAYDWLLKHPALDPERIGIIGRSMGGLISLLTASHFSTTKVIALHAPVFDAAPWINRKQSSGSFEHQGVRMNPTFLKEFVALQTLQALNKVTHIPLLHIQSINDQTIVPYHVEQYKAARKNAKAASEFIEFQRSDHDFGDTDEQVVLLNQTNDFIKKYL